MKTKFFLTIASAMLIAIAAVFWIQSCRKPVGDISIPAPASKLLLRGNVIDKDTKLGIANATVVLKGIAEIKTDEDGVYTKEIDVSEYDKIEVNAKASGYGYGTTTAYIDKEIICINAIQLRKLNTPVTIGPSGGKIEVNNNEGFSTNKVELIIPPDAYSNNVNISVTPYEGIDVPGIINDARLNLVTADINTGGEDPTVPLTLVFPMPISDLGIDSLPVIYFDENEYNWKRTGSFAQINDNDGTASVKISHSATYSLAIYGRYVEEIGQTDPIEPTELNRNKSSKTVPWKAKVEYPNGIPNNTSANWLKNVVSQNTVLGNGRVSFFDSTYTTVNYIGYRPDSTANTKSTNCVIWIWQPRLCGEIIIIIEIISYGNFWLDIDQDGVVDPDEMFMWYDLNNNGERDEGELFPPIEVHNDVYKEIYSYCSYWECIHDQGGGK